MRHRLALGVAPLEITHGGQANPETRWREAKPKEQE